MSNKKRWVNAFLIFLAIILWILILYPKQWVVGGLVGGPLPPFQEAYREEYLCIGAGFIIPPINCADCGASYPCIGILVNKRCSIEVYDPNAGIIRTPIACKGS